jgi:hypothetical protein
MQIIGRKPQQQADKVHLSESQKGKQSEIAELLVNSKM